MDWFSQYGLAHFLDFDALKNAFLARFRKEKTPNDIITKIKDLTQKGMLVEDYAQKFRVLTGRLQGADALSPEMKASYFLNGFKRTIQAAVVNVDIGAGFDELVTAAVRVEKRLGYSKKKKKKSRVESDSNTNFDSKNDDLDTDDSNNSDIYSD